MPDDRDPRVDPRPGDELEVTIDSGQTMTLSVDIRGPSYVVFHADDSKYPSDLTIQDWCDLCRNARVVARGGEVTP